MLSPTSLGAVPYNFLRCCCFYNVMPLGVKSACCRFEIVEGHGHCSSLLQFRKYGVSLLQIRIWGSICAAVYGTVILVVAGIGCCWYWGSIWGSIWLRRSILLVLVCCLVLVPSPIRLGAGTKTDRD